MKYKEILSISRPRFWIYELGTYALGVIAGLQYTGDLNITIIIIFGIFFTFPANLLIYGINDIFDYETDKLNPKKVDYEKLLTKDNHSKIFKYIFITNIIFVIICLILPWKAIFALLLFYFFAIFYSAPPIRAKARPIIDSFFSASHYVVTGIFGYYLAGGSGEVFSVTIAGLCWAMAMHAYSAVPDMHADKQSGISTIAIKLGRNYTIILCGILYIIAGILVFKYVGFISIILVLPYIVLMILSYFANENRLFHLYKYFPKINSLVGMVLFFLILFKKY